MRIHTILLPEYQQVFRKGAGGNASARFAGRPLIIQFIEDEIQILWGDIRSERTVQDQEWQGFRKSHPSGALPYFHSRPSAIVPAGKKTENDSTDEVLRECFWNRVLHGRNERFRFLADIGAHRADDLFIELRRLIVDARQNVARTVNAELILLHWHIGRYIRRDILKKNRAAYGDEILQALSAKLATEFGLAFRSGIKLRWYVLPKCFPMPGLSPRFENN